MNLKAKIQLPYNVDIDLLGKVLADLKISSESGINLDTLWSNIGATADTSRSYTMNLAKYLRLVDNDGVKVWLTPFGRSILYLQQDKRNGTLIQNLPEHYATMAKWLLHSPSHSMLTSEFKARFSTTYSGLGSGIILERIIASFLRYCKFINLVSYFGKGQGTKAQLTDFGKRALENPSNGFIQQQASVQTSTSKEHSPEIQEQQLQSSAESAILIVAKIQGKAVKPLDIDLELDTDWDTVNAHLSSLRKRWDEGKK